MIKLYIRISFISILILSACASTRSQSQSSLDTAFSYNFVVLDSVVSGERRQRDLNNDQTAFLYLIATWSSVDVKFDHNNGFTLNKSILKQWKDWYKKYSSKIDEKEFNKVIEINIRLNKEVVSEADMDFVSAMSKKYRGLKD